MPNATDMNSGLTAEYLRYIVRYEPGTGLFYWRNPSSRMSKGSIGSLSGGYLCVSIVISGIGRMFHLNRLAWLYMTGEWPKGIIDHINRKKSDNRWLNLRDVNFSENGLNANRPCNNKSGVTGVCFEKESGKWYAGLTKNGIRVLDKRYSTFKEAVQARQEAELQFIGRI